MNANNYSTRPFHVLALSGGGFRGLYTASVLAVLEERLGPPLASHFDLICGTSAGGLLAMGVAAEIPATELQAMFSRDGGRIFDSRKGWRRVFGPWFRAKHSAEGLREVLTEKYGNKTLGELKHRVLIPTVNYSKGGGQFFKTPHAKQFETDFGHRLVDVGLATAAAPTYFPMHTIERHGVYVDGGLVGNSPGFFGLHEARHALGAGYERGDVRVLAVGTMTRGATKSGYSGLDWGYWQWKNKLFDLVIATQEKSTDIFLSHLLNEDYMRIDDIAASDQGEDVKDLDVVTPGTIEVLSSRGTQAARGALGNPRFAPFRAHVAPPATFFHGPNKNSED